MNIRRIFKHLFGGPWQVRRVFTRGCLQRIEEAIADSERSHLGELRFVVEAALPWQLAMRGVTARQRAVQLFSELGVWDTEHNSGVLIYLLLTDRDIEIIADRGIDREVGGEVWENICREMEGCFREGRFGFGVMQGISHISALQQQYFPADQQSNPNELPDAPIVM